ncbi:MAG: hypothetical protein LBL01_02670, partial [Bifidobacteriaceae bacterium]|nr:hypothetical protein [Bifidobacteriaceae bacterium]
MELPIHRLAAFSGRRGGRGGQDGAVHFTLQLPEGRRDYWAEDGATLGQALADLGLDGAASWDWPLDGALADGALVRPLSAGHSAEGAATFAETPAAGGWRLVSLGGPEAGRELSLRGEASPVRAGRTKRGRVRLGRRRASGGLRELGASWPDTVRRGRPGGPQASGPVWLGRVRRGRSGRLRASWRRLWRTRRSPANRLLRAADGGLFALLRDPLPEDPKDLGAPRRPWRAAITTAATGLAMAGVMFAMTRNPVWAAMPMIGVVASVAPMLARRPREPWLTGAIGLDPAAASPLTPGALLELLGPGQVTASLARRLIAESLPAGAPLPAIAAPQEAGWEWSRFAPLPGAGGSALAIEKTARGLRLAAGPGWPETPTGRRTGRAGTAAARMGAGRGQREGTPEPLRLVVRDAGLGLIAARGPRGEAMTAAGMASGPLEELARRRALAGGRQGAAPFPAAAPEILRNWDAGAMPAIGHTPGGDEVTLDLRRDGPHALVAGTSGSGKSEFLRALMLAEAVTAPPDRLAIVGLDHKGGATFRDLECLPHVVGVATDLDAAGTARVLTSLEAELANRERLLERRGVAAWRELPAGERPARLLVVVDEFRTLLDSLPEAQIRLERLAAQGRSLGMGLILATQRPAGAVSAQLRANLALRVCFRVAGDADSLDVLGSPDAARIDPAAPGSCVVATAGRPDRRLRVRLVPPPARRPAVPAAWPAAWEEPPAARPDVAELVRAVAAAALQRGSAPPPAPWRPPLGPVVDPAALNPSGPASVILGLADLPELQAQEELSWDPSSGHLAVLGAPRSGRTQAAVTAAAGLAGAGLTTHVITHRPEAFAVLAGTPTLGAVVDAKDTERVQELLAAVGRGCPALVVDGASELEAFAVAGMARPLVEALAQGSLAPGARLVVTGPPTPSRWLAQCPNRLVLPVPGLADDLALGVPREFAAARLTPGRACRLGGERAVLAQVALTLRPPPGPAPLAPPARVLPLPTRVCAADLPPDGPSGSVWVGLGGAYGTPVALPVEEGRPVAVVGPHGSGRSTALAHIRRRL